MRRAGKRCGLTPDWDTTKNTPNKKKHGGLYERIFFRLGVQLGEVME